MVSRINLRVDVTGRLPLSRSAEIAVWVFLPCDNRPTTCRRPTAFFLLPGAGYGRSYFDLHVPGYQGFSLAEHLAESGFIVMAIDYIGTGDSTPYEPFDKLTKDLVIEANQAVIEILTEKLEKGTLTRDLSALRKPRLIGVGHSMGGYLITQQQARFRTFDAIGILGWTQLGPPKYMELSGPKWLKFLAKMPDRTRPPRELFRELFYDATVPSAVRDADTDLAVRVYSWVFTPEGHGVLGDPASPDAARKIEVPVFLGFGSRDISRDPLREAACYTSALDVTILILPGAAHCFNFSHNRLHFFRRMASWAGSIDHQDTELPRV